MLRDISPMERDPGISPSQPLAQGNAAAKAAPKGEAKKRPKIKKKYSGLSKEAAW
jgi:hypothetical protein